MRELTQNEMLSIKPGAEPITLGVVLAVMAIGVIAVIMFKLFASKSGSTKIPGGWSFEWK